MTNHNTIELMKVYNALVALGFNVSLVPCNDGYKVRERFDRWDIAINSLTQGHEAGLVEFYETFNRETTGCLTAIEAVQIVLKMGQSICYNKAIKIERLVNRNDT